MEQAEEVKEIWEGRARGLKEGVKNQRYMPFDEREAKAGDRLDSDGIGPVADDMDLNFSRIERKAMSSIDWVAQQVLVGNVNAAQDLNCLKSYGVTHILNLASSKCPNFFPQRFYYKSLPLTDTPSQNIMQYFPETSSFIHDAKRYGGTVFVHCIEGKSRSATCVIAYLMDTENYTLQEALMQVKSGRPIVQPNEGFMIQLQHYESVLRSRASQTQSSVRHYNVSPGPAINPNPILSTGSIQVPVGMSASAWPGQRLSSGVMPNPPAISFNGSTRMSGPAQVEADKRQQERPLVHRGLPGSLSRRNVGGEGASSSLHAVVQQKSLSNNHVRAKAQRDEFELFRREMLIDDSSALDQDEYLNAQQDSDILGALSSSRLLQDLLDSEEDSASEYGDVGEVKRMVVAGRGLVAKELIC
ncbi:hypothetical protein GUITHDRAFT_143482 [Guillardia theta CCMP2712]|uniref:Protein-serine/threonine phosphatase n=2 Tax=Guillardia theta TaxID=55529 RepID=L1IUB4_GUITC|nr:hypothetical protein GUITHDRAFT_143482 [Guillardia theta CCMP2712]EKX39494.1 hypothetical protein GUITHDRAFT_143482 [Guillardia theta CCMP2712]|eukprot:XP_005826474.1 hypothetical protein GUITHDRAFT_143482 [Guillardia theta CCMP2712]